MTHRRQRFDRTHYAPMTLDQLRAHAAQVPYGPRRGEENPLFLDPAYAADEVVGPTVEGLGEKLGVILFQVAPQPSKGTGGARGLVDGLHRFLAALPTGPRYALEVRDRALLSGAYAEALADVGALHCLSVHPRLPPLDEQALAAGVDAQPELLVRWMLHAGLDYAAAVERYAPFGRLVDEDEATRRSLADLAAQAARRSRPVTVVVNNKAEGSSPLSVFALAAEIARRLDAPDHGGIL